MFLLMDSNIFIQDFRLYSKSFKEIHENSEKLGIKLFVSSVVFEEVVQKYRERLIEFNSETKKFKNIVPQSYLVNIPEKDIDKLVEEYDKFLDKKLTRFNRYSTRFILFDQINFSNVYQKSLKKIKPFTIDGKGFRDALIWEQIKWVIFTYCDQGKKLAFITNNLKDFCDLEANGSQTEWYLAAKNLREELIAEGFSEDSVRIYRNLKSFNRDVVYKKLKYFDDFKLKFSSRHEKFIDSIIESLAQQDKLIVYDDKFGNIICRFEKLINAEIVDGYNPYGNSTEEVVLQIRVDILCDPLDYRNNSILASGETYIYVNINTEQITISDELYFSTNHLEIDS